MNSKQQLQATYFDNSDWLTKNHTMTKQWANGENNTVSKTCCRCGGKVILNKSGRVIGSLAATCKKVSERTFTNETEPPAPKQLTLDIILDTL
jgi:hypothetical protein